MTTRNRTLGALAALAAVAALAGCGGSGPSKAEFAKKADALCTATNKAHPPKTGATTAAGLADEIKIRTDLDGQLKALKVPDSARADFDAYSAGTKRILAAIATLRADIATNKSKLNADSEAYHLASVAREKSAVKLGFKTCGRTKPTA